MDANETRWEAGYRAGFEDGRKSEEIEEVITVRCPDCGDYFAMDGLDGLFHHAVNAHPQGFGKKVIACMMEELGEEVDAL